MTELTDAGKAADEEERPHQRDDSGNPKDGVKTAELPARRIDDIHLDEHLRFGEPGGEALAPLRVGGIRKLQPVQPVDPVQRAHRAPADGTAAVEENGQMLHIPIVRALPRQLRARARCAASSTAAIMLDGSAMFRPAMSNAVPWSTDVRMIGRPSVTLTDSPNARSFTGISPWSW